jgi:hypothetical protein
VRLAAKRRAAGRLALLWVARSGKLADGGSSRPAGRNLEMMCVCIAFCQNFKEENATQNPRRNYRPASLLEIGTPACKNIFHATPAADLFPFRRIKLHHQRQGSDSRECENISSSNQNFILLFSADAVWQRVKCENGRGPSCISFFYLKIALSTISFYTFLY